MHGPFLRFIFFHHLTFRSYSVVVMKSNSDFMHHQFVDFRETNISEDQGAGTAALPKTSTLYQSCFLLDSRLEVAD